MSKNINVPKLRFKEFSGEWEDKLFGEIATNKSKKHNPQKDKNYYKCIELEHLSSENGFLLGYIDSLNSESIKNMFNKNDVLFGKLRPYLKKYLLAPFDGVCSSEIWVLNGIEVSNSFLYYIVQGEYFINLANQSSGSKMPRADWDNISNSIFFIPQKEEQEKIALFLSSIDTKIEQLIKKDKLLQQYKKSIIQKIFNQEIRFTADNGNGFPEWEEKKLKNLCDVIKGDQLNKDNLTEIGDYLAINGGINPSGFTDKWNTLKNTITISEGGNSCGYVNFIKTNFWSGGHNYSLQNLKENIKNRYLFQYLKYNENLIMNLRVGSGLPNIQKSDIVNFKILLPCIEEQNKIANFLSSIDDKIEENQKVLEKAKEFKKSLLQQMFI